MIYKNQNLTIGTLFFSIEFQSDLTQENTVAKSKSKHLFLSIFLCLDINFFDLWIEELSRITIVFLMVCSTKRFLKQMILSELKVVSSISK